jgi:hypothetical protein
MKPKEAIERFLKGIPQKYQVEEQEDVVFNGILVEIDESTGKTTAIERLQRYIKREELLGVLW